MESNHQEHKQCDYKDSRSPNQTGRNGNWRPHRHEKSAFWISSQLSPDLEDADSDKWNDVISYYFDKIKTTQDTLAQLMTERRRNPAREIKEREIEREHKRSKEIEVQNSQHREEINKVLHKFKTPSEENEPKTGKLTSLSIPTFDGDPTKWKSYWQQFEATIHNSKKLDDQLRMQ